MKLKVIELFGGIGACTKALKRLGVEVEVVDYVEIDKHACASYNAINGTHFEPQDVSKWDKDVEVDLIMHGSPCQDFSIAGLQAGGNEGSGTRSSLMYETVRIVKKVMPKYVIWENVANLLSQRHIHNFSNYLAAMDEIGYRSYYSVLNSKDYGIPQNRERVFTISIRKDIPNEFRFPAKQELKLKLKDMLEENVGSEYNLSEKGIKYVTDPKRLENNWTNIDPEYAIPLTSEGQTNWTGSFISVPTNNEKGYEVAGAGDSIDLQYPGSKTRRGRVGRSKDGKLFPMISRNKRFIQTLEKMNTENGVQFIDVYNQQTNEEANTITAGIDKRNNHALYDGFVIRKITPKEAWRLMGFDDEDFERAAKVNAKAQLYQQAGNSIVVNVLEAIFTNLFFDQKDEGYRQSNIFDFL